MQARAAPNNVGRPRETSADFNTETFESLSADLQSRRTPLPQVTLSDDQVAGLRVIVRKTGTITYHVNFGSRTSRRYQKIGEWPGMTVEEARKVARGLIALSARGIDPWKNLDAQIIEGILTHGEKWRPAK